MRAGLDPTTLHVQRTGLKDAAINKLPGYSLSVPTGADGADAPMLANDSEGCLVCHKFRLPGMHRRGKTVPGDLYDEGTLPLWPTGGFKANNFYIVTATQDVGD